VTTAQRRNARGHRNPLRLLAFVVGHLRTLRGLMALVGHPPIRSFAAADFHGLHAYYLVDGEGRRQAFRYHWTATMADEHTVTRQEAALWPPQFLVEEMRPAPGARTGALGADRSSWPRTAIRPTIS
jgi:catalase